MNQIREIHTEKANEKRLIHQLNNLARSEGIRQITYLTLFNLLTYALPVRYLNAVVPGDPGYSGLTEIIILAT